MPDIEFLLNQANKVEGLQYAGFETFKGSPYASCARETGQNSRDAAVSKDIPVKVRFKLLNIPRKDVPFADRLQRAIEDCLKEPQDKKTEEHLIRARRHVMAETISVLEISDTNTTGLTGPTDDPHSIFAALVKGDGVTLKADPTSAGSYGIGKNAAYAVSELQTVVYSSCWNSPKDSDSHFAAQGRLRLISHNAGATSYSAEGYWGNPGFAAVEDRNEVPSWMRRQELGTSIFSVGFRNDTDWEQRMVLSLATNFFAAIERSEIEFVVGLAPITIDATSLDHVLSSRQLYASAEAQDKEDSIQRAKTLLRCIRHPTERHTIHVEGLGDFVLHILVDIGLRRGVHVIRNGIYITDNFGHFKQPLRQFPGTKEFVAVLEPASGPTGAPASTLLKRLENPSHDAFEPDRIVDQAENLKARRQIKTLLEGVRSAIRTTAKMGDINESQLDELSHLFAQGGVTSEAPEGGNRDADPERFRSSGTRMIPVNLKNSKNQTEGYRQRGGADPGRGDTKTGRNSQTSTRMGARQSSPIANARSVPSASNSPNARTIHFTPTATGTISLVVRAAGLSGEADLKIIAASHGEILDGGLSLGVIGDQRVSLDVTFDEEFIGPIDLIMSYRQPESVDQP